MIGALPYKTKQFFFLLIKLSVVVGAFYFIYQKLTTNEFLDFNEFTSFLIKNKVFSLKNVSFLLFLTILNWFFEILKWQNLVSIVKKITFYTALKQSLAALTASLFTPNRIGDYAAKAIYFEKKLRTRVVLLNLLAHMNQMLVTTSFGIVGITLFMTRYDLDIPKVRFMKFFAMISILFVFFFFGIKHRDYKIRGFSLQKIFDFIKEISSSIHIKTISYSLFRYLIFSFQFYTLLTIFGVQVPYFNAMIVITTMYFLSSILPTLFIFDVVIKGSIALYLFESVGVNNLTILCIITLMWLLNFVIPSLFGSLYILNFKMSTKPISTQ